MKEFETALRHMLASQTTCCLASVTEDGFPKIRAMLLPVEREGNTFYFHTNTPSQKVGHFRSNPKACLYFFDPEAFQGLCLIGTVRICEEEETRSRIWKEEYAVYYRDYSDFCVLSFTAERGDLYGDFSVKPFRLSPQELDES